MLINNTIPLTFTFSIDSYKTQCNLLELASLMLNTFLSSHAFFALGWLGFFGIIDAFNLWLSRGWRSSTWRISSSPSSTLGAPPSTTTLAPTKSGKQTNRQREADTSPTGSSHMARDALQHSLYRPETTSPKGSSQYRSREALNIAHRKLSTSPSLSSVCPVLLSTPLLATSTTWRALSYPSSSQTQAVAT